MLFNVTHVTTGSIVFVKLKQKRDSTTWWCSVRNKTTSCSATVLQKGDNFTAGRTSHCHTANPGTVTAVKITAQVFQPLKDFLPQSAVRGFVADFESAFLRQQDCIFKYVRKLMALLFLPADHIRPVFRCLKDLQTDPLQCLVKYVEDTWINSTVWHVESWTVFSQPTRANNDVEGWHRRINKKSPEEKKPFYLLLPKLTEEAELLPNQLKMVTECKLTRQRSTS
ncbi:Hypothetical predicted protein [Mytilus galloprovincialis]|uniref:FLYWCH-type domain-containing protein n=1 Tax=Mytilus galloprovincialis TaxID=29158 RepID=A0A8B6E3G8_MYTGA|nr:Hypothetical predicted protein [Mytilus galloprovincialis]